MSVPALPSANTPERRPELVREVVEGLGELVGGRPGLFVDRPGFIAGGGPDSPFPNTVRAISQLNCRIWASSDKSNYSDNVNGTNATLCNPYLDSLGELPDDGALEIGFEGGQCVGDSYNGGLETIFNPGSFVGGSLFGTGPVSAASILTEPSGNPSLPFNVYFQWTTQEGTSRTGGFNTNAASLGNIKILLINQTDSADPCGNRVAPEVRPPSTVTPVTPIPPRITVQLPGFGDVNISIDLGDDGNPTITFEEVGIDVELDIGGSDEGDGGGGQPPPGDVGEPGDGDPTGEGGESEGEAPDGSVLVGLQMNLISAPTNAREYAPGIYRAGAYIYMGGDGGLDQDFSGSMLSDGQFIFAEKENLTKWRVRANVSYNWLVIPFYRQVE